VHRPAAVAVVSVGDPESPQTWSGTTAGILAGMRELGVATAAVDLELSRPLELAMLGLAGAVRRNRYDAQSAPLVASIRSRIARSRAGEGQVDGIVQVGTTFSLPATMRYVTLEDMTLKQARVVHPVFGQMSAPAIRTWERRRAAVYSGARICAAASHWAADSLLADYRVPAERVAVVGLGPNHVRDPGQAEREWSSPRFLFVGIDWERKGGPLLLRAFARLRELVPEATLDLVGGHPPVAQPGVTPHGMRSPSREEDRRLMAELFARATCLVMPSSVEPFGIVHIEAAAAGIPSIGSSVGGPRDVIAPPHGGLVVDPGDEAGLVEALRRVSDPNTASRMGAAAQARARLYTWTQVAERLLRALGLKSPERACLADYL
jgi:glycosyltransferase involved in cell wall biosynthesis